MARKRLAPPLVFSCSRRAEQRLKQLQAHQSERGGGYYLKPDDPRCVEQQRLLDKLTADAKRISDLYEVRSAAWMAASRRLHRKERSLGFH
jgi:hypothetical protein